MGFQRESLLATMVALDPGHGGYHLGARGRRLKEKDVNLDVARRASAQLSAWGVPHILTRTEDRTLGLYERPALAEAVGAKAFVSIHCNASDGPKTGHGTETFYCHRESKCLGLIVHRSMVAALGRADRGLKTARFAVIREAKMPAVLTELMFIDNEQEEALLEQPSTREAAAQAIVAALRQYVEGSALLPPNFPPTGPLGSLSMGDPRMSARPG